MKFPYGLCDFQALIEDGYYYADRTDFIAKLEETGRHLLFLRPRRFGKSLLLSTLENYYDLAKADKFEQLFGHLKIGQNPTPKHNQYFVMRWDFSMVETSGTEKEIEAALHEHINSAIQSFALRYREYLQQEIKLSPENSIASLHNAVIATHVSQRELYLLIDEYDKFANAVMTAQQVDYPGLIRGEEFIKSTLKAVKALSAGQGISRVFMTGAVPVVMSDISSGYNIASNLSLDERFAHLCGLTEGEIITVLEQLAKEDNFDREKTAEAQEIIRASCGGYSFSYQSGEQLYHPTLALSFLKELQASGAYPKDTFSNNLNSAKNQMKYIASLRPAQDLIAKALSPEDLIGVGQFAKSFGVKDMLYPHKDQIFTASLLYYLGMLSIGERNMFGELQLYIPNLVVRHLYEHAETFLIPILLIKTPN